MPPRGLAIAGREFNEFWCSQGQAWLGLSAVSHRCLLCARYLLGKSDLSSTLPACPVTPDTGRCGWESGAVAGTQKRRGFSW